MCLNNTSRTHCCATTATMAMPARHSVMLYVNSLSCYCFIQRRCHLLLFHGSVVEKRNVIMENWWNTDGKKTEDVGETTTLSTKNCIRKVLRSNQIFRDEIRGLYGTQMFSAVFTRTQQSALSCNKLLCFGFSDQTFIGPSYFVLHKQQT